MAETPAAGIRISRFLADCGIASRRGAEDFVRAGRVRVNGETIADLGRRVVPGKDKVEVDGALLEKPEGHLTLMYHKPLEEVVSRGDPEGRRTIYHSLPPQFAEHSERLRYAGRLDFMSEGLLLLSTDGELVHRLSHPSSHLDREYLVFVDDRIDPLAIEGWAKGGQIGEEQLAPVRIEVITEPSPGSKKRWCYRFTLSEGRNRQVRRMVEEAGRRVVRLLRVRVGPIRLGELDRGAWRELNDIEMDSLDRALARKSKPAGGRHKRVDTVRGPGRGDSKVGRPPSRGPKPR